MPSLAVGVPSDGIELTLAPYGPVTVMPLTMATELLLPLFYSPTRPPDAAVGDVIKCY